MLDQQVGVSQQFLKHQPARNRKAAQDTEHSHRAEEMQGPRKIAQQEANGDEVEEDSERARDAIVRKAALPVHVADRDLNDRSPMPRSQRRNEAVQFAVERNLLQD